MLRDAKICGIQYLPNYLITRNFEEMAHDRKSVPSIMSCKSLHILTKYYWRLMLAADFYNLEE